MYVVVLVVYSCFEQIVTLLSLVPRRGGGEEKECTCASLPQSSVATMFVRVHMYTGEIKNGTC